MASLEEELGGEHGEAGLGIAVAVLAVTDRLGVRVIPAVGPVHLPSVAESPRYLRTGGAWETAMVSDVEPLPEPASRRPLPWGPIGLVMALLFLAGAVGFVVGGRDSEVSTSAVDEGFLLDMSEHHDQAVTIALYELANGENPTARQFATEVLLSQRQELGQMARMLAERDVARPDFDPDRPAMGWMGMATTLATMPGMATDADLERLRTAQGAAADELFLTLMQAHHQGGIHMADDAAQAALDPAVRDLAGRIARVQASEVAEYQLLMDKMRAGAA